MKTRKEGFYWVKYENEWQVAQWVDGEWHLIYLEMSRHSRHLDQIDENRIERKWEFWIEESEEAELNKRLLDLLKDLNEVVSRALKDKPIPKFADGGLFHESKNDPEIIPPMDRIKELLKDILIGKPKTDIFDFAKENEKGATTPALFKALEKIQKRDEIETCLNERICPYCGGEVFRVMKDHFECIDCGAHFNPKQS